MVSIFKRNGFTLAELVMVFFVIGVVSVVGLLTIKPHKKQIYLQYSRAFDTLLTAAYNVYADESTDYNYDDAAKLCKGLIKYINVNDKITDKSTNACASVGNVSDTTTSVSGIKEAFVANNGMKYYISKKSKITVKNYEADSSGKVSADIEYYIVLVDLDGNEKGSSTVIKPDSSEKDDIVGFALTSEGDLIPLGAPSIDKNYLSVQVDYPQEEDSANAPVTSYFNATRMAWGDLDATNDKNSTMNDLRTYSFNKYLNNSSPLKVTNPAVPAKDAKCPEFDCDINIRRYY